MDEADDEVDTVVQPEIVVFCDKPKLTRRGAKGALDWVIEILTLLLSGAVKSRRRSRILCFQSHHLAFLQMTIESSHCGGSTADPLPHVTFAVYR
jgi:hypothetical protein